MAPFAPEETWTGHVRCDLAVPLGEIVLLEADSQRELARRRVHVPFFIELEDGVVLPVEPSQARLPEAEVTRGSWSSLRERFGSYLIFPEARRSVWGGWLELQERLVCNGDLITLLGELHRGSPCTDGYRAASERPAGIRARAVQVDVPAARERERLSARERSRYGVASSAAEGSESGMWESSTASRALDVLESVFGGLGDLLVDKDWD